MKTKLLFVIVMVVAVVDGCTTAALRRNTVNQSKTVGDILAEQVLYNLALYKNFYDGKSFNCIPCFVTLASGQAQVQQSISSQLGLKYPVHGSGNEYDPQITGTHQTQDNWSFTPVVDPNMLNRLYYLYRSQFKAVDEKEVTKYVFPPSQDLDQNGRPNLRYEPKIGENGQVLMTNNQPVFIARPKERQPDRHLADIPGALDQNCRATNGWWKIDPESASIQQDWYPAGSYLGRSVWITDRERFFKFAVLALGTNGSATTLLSDRNGLILFTR